MLAGHYPTSQMVRTSASLQLYSQAFAGGLWNSCSTPRPSYKLLLSAQLGTSLLAMTIRLRSSCRVGSLPSLHKLLSHAKKAIRKESCWTISNITAGNREQIQEVINNGLIPPVIHLLQTADFDIKKEAAWAISNATSGGSPQQVEYLVENNCINPLVDLLSVSDAKIIGVALEALENILKVGKDKQQENGLADNPVATRVEQADGLQKIEALQEDPNEDVYQKAMKILENYFPLEDEDADIGEVAGANQFQFGAQVPTGGFSFGS